MGRHVLTVEGMSCGHCVDSVTRALERLPGVRAQVSLEAGRAWVEAPAEISPQALVEAVTEAGFSAAPAREDSSPAQAGGGGVPRRVVIVGSGSAAMACATALAEQGVEVSVVERGMVGGTCVNIGCVPSKILIAAARLLHEQRAPSIPGVPMAEGEVDWPLLREAILARVTELRRAKYESIIESNPRIHLVRGEGRFLDPHTLLVEGEGETQRLTADRFLIASGSRPHIPEIPGLAETPYWTSTEALFCESLPRSLIVLGGGVVACELAQAHARLGARVCVVSRSRLLSSWDPAVGETLTKVFAGEGIEVLTDTPRRVEHHSGGFRIHLQGGRSLEAERLLVATGRRPHTERLALGSAGVEMDGEGAIRVDDQLRTSQGHIYAAGDCTDRPRLVYVAAKAGTLAAHNMVGEEARLDLSVLPQVVFTDPQVAMVGHTTASARRAGLKVVQRSLSLEYLPRALAEFRTDGVFTLLAEEGSGRLLGASLVSPRAGEVIQSAALAIQAGLDVTALADRLFPYLTEVEGLKLAAQTFTKDVTALSCCAG